jgi:hypothetical protein
MEGKFKQIADELDAIRQHIAELRKDNSEAAPTDQSREESGISKAAGQEGWSGRPGLNQHPNSPVPENARGSGNQAAIPTERR